MKAAKKEKTEHLFINLTKSDKQKLRKIAQAQHRNMTQVIKHWISEYTKESHH